MDTMPVLITFRRLTRSDVLESDVRERAASLHQFYPALMKCRVLLSIAHRHQLGGRRFRIRLELSVPGGEPIVVTADPTLHGELEDAGADARDEQGDAGRVHRHAEVVIREAFEVARRRLEDVARTQRGDVTGHEVRLPEMLHALER